MAVKRKSPSIRALEELHNLALDQCKNFHGYTERWQGSSECTDNTHETKDLAETKSAVIKKISKEIEEYAIKKYANYGLIVVPLCHRKSSSGDDRLEIDLKVKIFPEAKEQIAAKTKADHEFRDDLKRVDDWYFKALQAVALKEELPEIPTFSRS